MMKELDMKKNSHTYDYCKADVIKLPSFRITDIVQIFQLMTTKPFPLSTTEERNNLANAGLL